jgi:Xaa-Pro aminopeptidase
MTNTSFKYLERVSRLRARLAEEQLDGLLITNEHNRRYLSGFVGTAGYLLVTQDDAVLATDFRYTEQAGIQAPGWRVDRITGRLQWFPALVKEFGVRRLGFEADDVTVSLHGRLGEAVSEAKLEVELKPTSGITLNLRALKDPEEIALLQKAIDVSDQAFEEVAAGIEPGQTEEEIAWRFEQAVRNRGAESISFDTIVAVGPNAARPHHRAGDTQVVEGQTIVFDCGAQYQGYCSDLTRTVVVGKADDKTKQIYDIVHVAQLAAIEMIRPGMTGAEADGIARKVIEEAGHGDDFGHSLGHGVGLEVHENPGVGPNSTGRLEEGMVLTVEPGIYLPGWGGVRIEDVVVLERDGARLMSKAAKATF